MSQQITYTCNICGKTKGEANHWFIAYASSNDLVVIPTIDIRPWQGLHSESYDDLCGEAHLLEWISQNLKSLQRSQDEKPESICGDRELDANDFLARGLRGEVGR